MPGSRILEGYLPPLQAVKVAQGGANVRFAEKSPAGVGTPPERLPGGQREHRRPARTKKNAAMDLGG